jgi:hypothetical protein
MNYPRGMSGSEAVAHLNGDVDELPRRIDRRNRRAFDKLHDKMIGTDVVELADVRVIQRRNGAGFPVEAFAELRM